jgi:hypothetical protein
VKLISFYIFLSLAFTLPAQIGGTKAFRLLDLQVPARSAALGGATNAIWDDDVNLASSNPALLNPSMKKQLAYNHVNYVSDLSYGNVMYAHQVKDKFTFAAGLQYFNYGNFDGRDDYDSKTGTFKAADYSLNLSVAKPFNEDSTLSIGATLKTIYSHFDSYYALGSAVDVGLTYHTKDNLTVTLLAKNYGSQWRTYTGTGEKEKLPSTVQIGLSKKLDKAPFRLLVLYDQLLKWDLTYDNPLVQNTNIDPFTNKPIVKTKREIRNDNFRKGLDKFGRHLVIGTEIVISKNFNLRVAYNFKTGKEMVLSDKKTANGLALGFCFKVYKFHFNYGFSKYALTGNAHTFGITTNFNYFSKK